MENDKLVLEDLTKRFGSVVAVDHINLRVGQGQLISLLGPSGCGKTTTLRMIAGLETSDEGSIIVDGKILNGKNGGVLPEKRNMGMVFQSYAVWPHMTVEDNVAYGLKIKKFPRTEIAQKVRKSLEMVGLANYAKRYPTQLSGGQQQRVALARSLASEPSILLLDEPLSNLDAKLRENMRFEIRNLQQRLGITTIYVTHSQDEALAVSDEIVVMRDGKIMQRGVPEQVYSKPNSVFVAGFIGLVNSFCVSIEEHVPQGYRVRLQNGMRILAAESERQWQPGEKAVLLIRPETVELHATAQPEQTNVIPISISKVSFTGSIVNYFARIQGLEEEYRVQTTPPVIFTDNAKTTLRFPPEHCILVAE